MTTTEKLQQNLKHSKNANPDQGYKRFMYPDANQDHQKYLVDFSCPEVCLLQQISRKFVHSLF